jgi:polyisoprenoid-binding protein YceI
MPDQAMTNLALAKPATWISDPASSCVRFQLRRLWGLLRVTAEFERFAGVMRVVDFDLINADLTVDAASLHTQNNVVEEHLRSRPFLDVERYPMIQFEATTVEPTDLGWIVTGDLAICDADLRLRLPVRLFAEGDRLIALTRVRIACSNGADSRRLGMLGSCVVVTIELSLRRAENATDCPLSPVDGDHRPLTSHRRQRQMTSGMDHDPRLRRRR